MKKIFSSLLILFSVAVMAAEPFLWSADAANRTVSVTIAPGYYLDASALHFTPDSGVTARPQADRKNHYASGVHQWRFSGQLPDNVEYQGCSDSGLCLMPETFSFAPAAGTAAVPPEEMELLASASGMMTPPEFLAFLRQRPPRSLFADAGIVTILLLTLLGGLGLNLTPCVLPMVPVNLILIGAGAGGRSGLLRGCCYGIGMALAYGTLGILAAFAGVQFGSWSGSPLFNGGVALLFAFLALAMAGVFRFNFASSLAVDRTPLRRFGAWGAFLMGILAALLAGACVAPVLLGVLLFTVEQSRAGHWYAALLPLLLGIGMALPWPFAGWGMSILPRPGKFMVAVKYLFAAIFAAAAGYYGWLAWPGKSPAALENSGGFPELQGALQRSAAAGKPLLIDFTASWCKNCAAMERTTLADPEVQKLTGEKFIFFRFQAEDLTEPRLRALFRQWNLPGLPAFAIVGSGKPPPPAR